MTKKMGEAKKIGKIRDINEPIKFNIKRLVSSQTEMHQNNSRTFDLISNVFFTSVLISISR